MMCVASGENHGITCSIHAGSRTISKYLLLIVMVILSPGIEYLITSSRIRLKISNKVQSEWNLYNGPHFLCQISISMIPSWTTHDTKQLPQDYMCVTTTVLAALKHRLALQSYYVYM
jgi:hypothetical protein